MLFAFFSQAGLAHPLLPLQIGPFILHGSFLLISSVSLPPKDLAGPLPLALLKPPGWGKG